jgi:hypothetical protein
MRPPARARGSSPPAAGAAGTKAPFAAIRVEDSTRPEAWPVKIACCATPSHCELADLAVIARAMLMHSPDDRPLPEALENHLALVNEGLVKIAGGENPQLDLRNLRAVLLKVREMAGRDASITAAVDEVFEAALAYQAEFAHAVKAGKDASYGFLLLAAARMERSLGALRAALRNAKPSASARIKGALW